MNEYQLYIHNLAITGKDAVFYNSGPEHASFVLQKIFENASNTVNIYAGCFSGEISNQANYKEAMEKFLQRKGVKLKILLQNGKLAEQKKEPEIFQLLRFYSILNKDSIEIKKHPYHLQKDDGREIHFTVADNKMYRLEDDIEKFTAIGNFNDPLESNSLSLLFDDIFNDPKSEAIELVTR